MIPFNQAAIIGNEADYLQQALSNGKLSGNGDFTCRCEQWLEQNLLTPRVLLTPSCTAALEMAAILLDLQPDDEIIMPSYTFVSTANAFVLRGAKIVFVDIRPDTMNIDESKIEAAITPNTRAIVPVHYAGVACEMDTIMALAEKYDLFVVEDAAQAMLSYYKGKALGTIGHLGCLSFHETKNYTAGGEGGALLINEPKFIERAEIIREKGTNRSQFFRGEADKYSWRDIGSSYLMSELQAAYLYAQLEQANSIAERRMALWDRYFTAFRPLSQQNFAEFPQIPTACQHNAHLFYLKLADLAQRTAFLDFMRTQHILSVFHYVPLHSSSAGQAFGRFIGDDQYTTLESERLVRLPLFYNLSDEQQSRVITAVYRFFGGEWQA